MGPKSQEVREALGVLLASLTKDERRDAIALIEAERPITKQEIFEATINAEPG